MGWLVAILSGTLAGLAYPARFGGLQLPELGFLGFLCWVPLMLTLQKGGLKRAFLLSSLAGLFHFSISQFWLYPAINTFGGLSPGLTVIVLSLLIGVLSAYFGLIFWISGWICKRLGWKPLWVRPLVWVAIEYLRHLVPMGGYPWSQLGYTQGGFLAFIQSAEIWGAYGITFLMVLANEILAQLIGSFRSRNVFLAPVSLALACLLLLANLLFGLWRQNQPLPPALAEVNVGIVQGNISQEEKWQRGKAREIIATYVEGTRSLEEKGADLILWPEASFPVTVPFDGQRLNLELGNDQATLILGAITRSLKFRGSHQLRPVFNSALILDPEGNIIDYYHKKKLVPFGEYVPYRDLLFFARKLTAEVGDLQPGLEYRPVRYGNYRLGILICYEDIFPFISRKLVAGGANALVNITNDAWYGFSSAPYQHQVYSQYRSVETRRFLIRATNTGISSLIDPFGEIQWQGELFTREDFLSKFPLLEGETLFVKVGYLLPHIFLIIMAGLMLGAWRRGKRHG